MNILLTAIGKRVQLVKHLKKTFQVIGTDSGELVPASFFVDKFYKVPRYYEDEYIQILLEICEEEKVDIIIPLYEKEFSLLSKHRSKMQEKGILLLLSDSEVINIFNSKLKTYEFFIDNNIVTPRTYSKKEVERCFEEESLNNLKYPLIVKPDDGMGSQNVFVVKSDYELKFFINYIDRPVIQEFIDGIEYTIDVLCDLQGKVISVVPRVRIETRSGEVSKTKTHKNTLIVESVINLCSKVKFVGPITIQCIANKDNIKFIEINPRFGGGVPLTFECGVNYGEYIRKMRNAEEIKPSIGEFDEKVMLRYDEAVIL